MAPNIRSLVPWLFAAVMSVPLLFASWQISAQEEQAEPEGEEQEEGAMDPRAALTGTFVLAESRQEATQRVHAAIDEVASEVSFFLRSFARRRLREKNPIHHQIRTELSGGQITVAYESDTYQTQDGQWATVMAAGERTQLLQQVRGRRIYQTFRTDDGEKRMVLTASDDGQWMWLDVTVTSERLPRPLQYRLRFRRGSA